MPTTLLAMAALSSPPARAKSGRPLGSPSSELATESDRRVCRWRRHEQFSSSLLAGRGREWPSRWSLTSCRVGGRISAAGSKPGARTITKDPANGLFSIPPSPSPIRRGPTGSRRIALTFDDGPCARTDEILDILASHDARATFFMIGKWVPEYEHVLRRLVDCGHEIGNHSFDHAELVGRPVRTIYQI